MDYYLSPVTALDAQYLEINTFFTSEDGKVYSFKISTDVANGVVIKDTVGRSMPIDWYDIPEFTRTFKQLNSLAVANEYNFYNS